MPTANEVSTPRGASPTALLKIAASAALGAAFGFVCIRLAQWLHVPVKALGWSDLLALVIGTAFLAFGVIAFALSASRRRLARTMEGECAELPATSQEVRNFRMQASVLVLAGILLMSPILAMGPLSRHPNAAAGVFAGMLVLVGLETGINVSIWRDSDEFARSTMVSVGAITFAIGQGVLFLWAAAERLHLVPAISAWDILTLLMALYLAVGILVSTRKMR